MRGSRASIVVTHGDPADVSATVASALDQTARDVEVVVVDARGASGAPWGDPRVRRVESEDLGFAAQVNAALATIAAPLVQVVPAGDRLAPESVAAQAEALAVRPDVGAVFSLADAVDGAGRRTGTVPRHETGARTRDELLPPLLGGLEIAVASALVRREVLAREGGLDPLYTTRAAAHDLWLRVLPRLDAVLLADRLARVRDRGAFDPIERAERGVAQVRALRREGVERFLAPLGGGPGDPEESRAAARLALADAMLASDPPGLLAFVHRLVAEACALGAEVGASRASRLAAAGLPGFSFPACGAERRPAPRALAATAPQRGTLGARRAQLAGARAALAAEHVAAAGLVELGREVSERTARAALDPMAAPVDPRPLVEEAARIADRSDEILAALRIGSRLRRAARRLWAGVPSGSRRAEPPRPRGGSA